MCSRKKTEVKGCREWWGYVSSKVKFYVSENKYNNPPLSSAFYQRLFGINEAALN